jgi:hypothetical protein
MQQCFILRFFGISIILFLKTIKLDDNNTKKRMINRIVFKFHGNQALKARINKAQGKALENLSSERAS